MWTLLSHGVLALIMFVVKYNNVFFFLCRGLLAQASHFAFAFSIHRT